MARFAANQHLSTPMQAPLSLALSPQAGRGKCPVGHGGGSKMRTGGAPGQRAENSQHAQNPICAPEASWRPAVPEGQNASPGGLRPNNPSIESSEEPGFVPSRGRFLARMKFSSQRMLTAEREPTENTTISWATPFRATSRRATTWPFLVVTLPQRGAVKAQGECGNSLF